MFSSSIKIKYNTTICLNLIGNRQESCSSTNTSWRFKQRHLEFKSHIPQLLNYQRKKILIEEPKVLHMKETVQSKIKKSHKVHNLLR